MPQYQIGYHGKLRLITQIKNQLTYPKEVFYSPPFKLTNYFRLSNGGIEYILMNASAGIMATDNYTIDIEVVADSKLVLSSQSYEKIHKMDDSLASLARRNSIIKIGKNAYFCYNQLPIIPFADSAYSNQIDIWLEDATSVLVFGEIIACGRIARHERFSYCYLRSLVNVYCAEKLVYRDNCIFEPKKMDIEGFGLYEGYSHIGMMIIYGVDAAIISSIEIILQQGKLESGITQLLAGGYLIRGCANHAESLVNVFAEIEELTHN